MTTARIIHGAERSARADIIDRLVLENWGHALLLTPTRRLASLRMEKIVRQGNLPGAWGRFVITPDDFAAMLLRGEGMAPVLLRDNERRLLLNNAIEMLRGIGKLDFLGAAAETGGFRSHVMRVITQLKQAAIEPDDFRKMAAKRRMKSLLDDVVAEVYSAYQEALVNAGAYDKPGLFWKADWLCRDKRPKALDGVKMLALDGFDDFTPSEFRLLVSASAHVESMIFGVNYDPSGNRTDLYKSTARTLEQIRKDFEVSFAHAEEPPPKTLIEYASSNIFWRDENETPPDLERNLEILPCVDMTQEIETIGRRVKKLLLDDAVPASEIAIVYRNLRDVTGSLRSAFAEFGVPLYISAPQSVWDSAVFSFLMDLFDALDSWSRESVVNTLSSHWFNPSFVREDDSWNWRRDGFHLLSRAAQVISGLDEWRERLGRLAQYGDEEVLGYLKRLLGSVDAAITALSRGVDFLENLGKRIPKKGRISDYATALNDVIDSLGLVKAIEARPLEETRGTERSALEALRETLGTMILWEGENASTLTWGEFLALFRQTARETTFITSSKSEGVSCFDAESARLLRFDYVFFANVNEGEVPKRPISSAIYSEEDLNSLAEQGVVLEGRRAHAEREALMFHHVLNMPRKQIWISWRMLSNDGGEQYPSPYLTDLLNMFRGYDIQKPFPKAHDFAPNAEYVSSWRDARNMAGKAGILPEGIFQEQFEFVRRGVDIECKRRDQSPFGIYDGVLENQNSLDWLKENFNDKHVYSVNQLETYVECPFRFFVERILEVKETPTPVAEFDAMVRGSILHGVLQAFHEQYRGKAIADIDENEALESMRAHAEQVFPKKAWRSATAPRGVEAIEKMRIMAALERYLLIERERGEDESQWKPSHFEIGFGKTPGANSDPLTKHDPFALKTRDGDVLFAGRIDRLDIRDNESRVIDYKSGSPPTPKKLSSGESLQLAIYAMAVDVFLLPDKPCGEAYFMRIGQEKRQEALHGKSKKEDEWPDRRELVRNIVAKCVRGIKGGSFPPTRSDEGTCKYCPGKGVCRYEQSRITRKENAS
jgi:ATP-dependent helicase/DNAse subunit B